MNDETGGPDIEKLRKAAALLPTKERLEKYRAIDRVVLHPKQQEFVDLTASCAECAVIGANQSGKSLVGAYILVMHLTGDYPPFWRGRRFDHPINAWCLGPTAQHVRDVLQKKIVGENIADPTGLIPLDAYDNRNGRRAITKSHGLPDAVDQVRVKHKSGGTSLLTFKSHEQGREKLQGSGVHVIYSDEDCPLSIWGELIARGISTQGLIYATFTPVMGMLPVAQRFLQERSPQRGHVIMALKDALHIPVERHQAIIDSIPEHERDARVYGIPSAGSGKVFRTLEDQVAEDTPGFIPPYWPALWGSDFGYTENHPFAAVLGVWDRDYDIIHIIHAVRIRGGLPRDHAAAIRSAMNGRAGDIPIAWPHDGAAKSRESGRTVAQLYRDEKLNMLGTHATLPKSGGIDLEAGIALMAARLRDGRLKVARHLSEWFQEYRMYHRLETGLVNKTGDDLMSATRILCMQIRSAKEIAGPGYYPGQRQQQQYAKGTINNEPFDVFTGRPFGAAATHDRQGRPVARRDYDVFNP
jgi:phage terminase large subunit-like protein